MQLKKGMYVRFNDLTNYNKNNIVMIDKIKFISEVMCGLEETLSITFEKYNEDVLKKDIIKASYNIIDLVEVGDYVNGEKVGYVDEFIGAMRQYYYDYEDINKDCGHWQEEIKTILTKEQFENNVYRIGE